MLWLVLRTVLTGGLGIERETHTQGVRDDKVCKLPVDIDLQCSVAG